MTYLFLTGCEKSLEDQVDISNLEINSSKSVLYEGKFDYYISADL